jgi:threonine dehydrogenase-like Zn-dependent dehydrogenase
MKALRQQKLWEPLQLEEVAIPTSEPGSAVIKILAASIISYTREIYDGTRKYPYVTPLTAGSSAIGRVHAVGPDATSLTEGQLVIFDITMRSRDDPSHVFLSAIVQGSTAGSKKLMEHWTDGSYAEYMKAPLENLFPLDEVRLTQELGYSYGDLLHATKMLVSWGGYTDIGLSAGETVVVAPATGSMDKLYPSERLSTVPVTGDFDEELAALQKAAGSRPVDAYFDISPDAASNASYFKAAIMSLRHSGRISLMGGQLGNVSIPHRQVMRLCLQLKGKWMYEREDVPKFLRLIENGNLPIGHRAGAPAPKTFGLGQWKEAFDHAADVVEGDGAVFVLDK